MNYFYARVSTREQNLDRQLLAAKEVGNIDCIFADKESGKSFERKEYQRMKSLLAEGDNVVVLSLDRFGRNYDEIKDEWSELTRMGVGINVIDMPTLNTTNKDDLLKKYLCDVVLATLSFVAQQEREKILQRQAQGIAAMKVVKGKHISARTGKGFGVEPTPCPGFEACYEKVKSGSMGVREAIRYLEISTGKWYRLCKYKEAI